MNNSQKPGAKASQAAAIRAERLAEQLRANLKRRKSVAKERPTPIPAGESADDGDQSSGGAG
jgi:hypothetical protein